MKRWTAVAVLVVLGVAAAYGAEGKKEEKPVKVEIKGMKFDPPAVTVKVGETVVWKNEDDRDHSVVSSDDEKEEKKGFKSGNIKRGETFEHKFTKAGKYPYSCSYHPRMKGVVVVTED